MVYHDVQERRYSIYPENGHFPVCGFEGFGPWLPGLAAFELGEAVCYGWEHMADAELLTVREAKSREEEEGPSPTDPLESTPLTTRTRL